MGSLVWKLLGTGGAVAASGLAERALRSGWRQATGTEPPGVPEDPDTPWREALAWALLSGAVVGGVRLLVARRAAAYYRRSTGELPAALRREG